ncbi:hypothetical protein ACO0SA_000659 [Hanseniaspora valbyensis]
MPKYNNALICLFILSELLISSNALFFPLNDDRGKEIVASRTNLNLRNSDISNNTNSTTNITEQTFYSVNVGIDQGNLWYVNTSVTGQEQQLRLDIAQPYLWVVDEATNPDFKASTYKVNESNISPYSNDYVYNMTFIDYIDFNASAYISNMTLDDSYSGTLANMKLNQDGITANKMGFFVAYDSFTLIGSLGIGGKINDTNWQETEIATNYFNDSFLVLDSLKNQGTISSAGYSLWLAGDSGNEVDLTQYETNSSSYIFSNFSVGSLMLDYVNSTLYTGDLVKFESIPYYEIYDEGQSFTSNGYPIFPLSGAILIANDSETANLTLTDDITPILFDSRYTSSYLPIDIIQQIAIQTNAYYVSSLESWYVTCELGDINAHIEFLFGQLSIEVPLKSFIVDAYMTDSSGEKIGLYFTSYTGEKIPACILKIKPSSLIGMSILGQTFLKYAYLAADLETNEFAIAQAADINGNYLNTETKVKRDFYVETTVHLMEKRETSSTTDSSSISSTDSSTESSATTTILSTSSQSSSTTSVSTTTSTSSSTSTSSASSSSSSSSSSTTSSVSSSSSTTSNPNATAQFISSGYIPFAKSSNITVTSLVLTKFSVDSTDSKEYGSNVLELFGYNFTYGSIFSNGEIVTATKSFYDTNLPTLVETTVSGSTYYTVKDSSTSTKSKSKPASYYVVSIIYETYVTKNDSTTTEYGTSVITSYSTVAVNSTSSQSNGGDAVQKNINAHNTLFQLLNILGFIWAFF